MGLFHANYGKGAEQEHVSTNKISALAVFCALSCNSSRMIESLLKQGAFNPNGGFSEADVISGYGIEGCSYLEYALIVSNDSCVASLIRNGAKKSLFINNFKNYELARVFIKNILGHAYYDSLRDLSRNQILNKMITRYERIANFIN